MTQVLIFLSEQWLLVSILAALIITFFWNEKRRSGKSLTFHQATRLLNDEAAILIDLREAKDFKAGHINNAMNIPYAKLKNSQADLDKHKEKTIILVDKMGQHAGAAGRELMKLGFDVGRLEGGMSEWYGQKMPVVK